VIKFAPMPFLVPRTPFLRRLLLAGAAASALSLVLCGPWVGDAHAAGASPYCPRPNELMRVGKSAALDYALSGLGEGFTVRAAHHPRSGDLGWSSSPGLPGGGFKTCAPRVRRLTWYFDLHPESTEPGVMGCHACDSHLYVVRYRSHKFATLQFSG
jgi:hypothetical protein